MNTEREIQTLYTDEKNEVTIICKNCGKSKMISTEKFEKSFVAFKVKCICDNNFNVKIDLRKFYRKKVNIVGMYVNAVRKNYDDILVEDLSMSGVGFKTILKNNIQIGETLEVRFTLDNERKTGIRKKVIVRRVNDHFIGAEFCDTSDYSAEIGFYLMPC